MNKKGFTLIEFLVGITMTAFIFIVATNLVISFLSINTKSQRSQDIEQAKSNISIELTNALQWGDSISFKDNTLHVGTDKYSVVGNIFEKNDTAFTSNKVKTTAFNVKTLSDTQEATSSSLLSYEVHLEFEHAESSSTKDSTTFLISPRLQ